jgi:hypothetical protein
MDLTEVLENTATVLDIPAELADEAVQEYEAVAAWLSDDDSELRDSAPEIYPQGSFRLGTPIRPLGHDDFDIDLVCKLALSKEQTTQQDLKARVGNRLKKSEELAARLEECGRCWTLAYGSKFHLDVLPAIPDAQEPPNGILLTDKKLTRWQFSNPIGYADWFYGRMGNLFQEAQQRFAKDTGVDVADVPRWRVRTPLQRAVQLLKRHRDVTFSEHPDDAPTSIIVTTLAGRAYGGETDIAAALLGLVQRMPNYIENRNGRWWIDNPAHAGENFADKWSEEPERRKHLLKWLQTFDGEFKSAAGRLFVNGNDRGIATMFRTERLVTAVSVVPPLADASHASGSQWPERAAYKCQIKATLFPRVRKGKRLGPLTDRGVPKNAGIRFECTTNTPLPFEVKWQVVNTGAEAAAAGVANLRGTFYDGEGPQGTTRWERTLYAGTHWVEAFVIKDGVCVARSGRKYVRVRK